jgi:hypothetical protein
MNADPELHATIYMYDDTGVCVGTNHVYPTGYGTRFQKRKWTHPENFASCTLGNTRGVGVASRYGGAARGGFTTAGLNTYKNNFAPSRALGGTNGFSAGQSNLGGGRVHGYGGAARNGLAAGGQAGGPPQHMALPADRTKLNWRNAQQQWQPAPAVQPVATSTSPTAPNAPPKAWGNSKCPWKKNP